MVSKLYEQEHRIRFSECDPAGIVFYPQYFVMFNDLMEAWIDSMVPEGFHNMIASKRVGMPSVHIEAEFKSISRMGDDVVMSLGVERIGNSSLTLLLRCVGKDGVLRMQVRQTVVTTSLETHLGIPIPDFLRNPMQAYVIAQPESSQA
ncbi:acyl-CoA thioesterase [Alcaligenes ammonioxydans]|jgi:4-hydroxybenzoyl-CoA thioesterase|uniref:Acyl-CoA thioesterase n=1 Tax=Alcaligenes ammonioxydans TaxID=2582914 RepID=A0ABX8SPI8_9BURK|nr:thioesterase family protein [Alcaligenes ammonioxydans]EJC65126.1 thioesterase superfamily protein [Alcaligenes faecalis subsp. faecalis NCIB 8687]QBH19575.1 acyl-CoA thioesterase [Alcaligenes faecalis]MCH1880003.1 acyl-CoA thioesterase [Alcaligenes ammonioxydans]QXX77584.1 acyl-CoA thioesterase [Alcaligenes ammonioxydans]WGQ35630.1 thioesterase family protein [Alcaligenes faecalis]